MSRRFDPLGANEFDVDDLRANLPAAIGEVVTAIGTQRGWQQRLEGARVHGRWEEIAGPELARHCEPVRLVGGVLVVRVASADWATQVRYLGTTLVERANAVLGSEQVRQLTVVVGALRAAPGQRRGDGVDKTP